MPQTKKQYKKKSHPKKYQKKGMKKGNHGSGDLVIYNSNKLLPFAPRYRCKMTTSIFGNVVAGSAAGLYYCNLNSPYLPFSGGGWPAASSTITTLQPAGFSSICNANLYREFRCLGSKITVEFLPQALTDTIEVALTPVNSVAVAPATTAIAMQQPYTKSGFMSSSKQNGKGTSALKSYSNMYQLLGVSRAAIENDLSGNYIGAYNADPTITAQWVVNWATPDAVNLAANCEYRVSLTHYVEFFYKGILTEV